MKNKEEIMELSPEEIEAEKLARKKRIKRRKVWTVIDRIFGFFLATGIMFGIAGLSLEFVLVKGPSESLKETFVMTMLETRRFRFIPNIFLTEEEVNEIKDMKTRRIDAEFDASLINIGAQNPEDGEEGDGPKVPDYGDVDEDGDGVIIEEVKGSTYKGYLLTLLDPTRLFIGKPDQFGGTGLRVDEMCEKYGALGGMNGGGYYDPGGGGLGGTPDGLTIVDGVVYDEGHGGDAFVGYDANGILYVGYYTLEDALNLGIVSGVTFGPVIVMNGEVYDVSSSGLNPRSAIGQRADGAILMLVLDGRQAHSAGAKYQDLADIMIDHGAVNAINLDGGSSSSIWFNGEYINSCASASGMSRPMPTTFLFK